MENIKNIFFAAILSLLPGFFSVIFAQQTQSEIIQSRIEFIAEQLESDDIDLTDVTDVLNYYYDNKLDLNTATADDLRSLMLLTDIQINALLIRIKDQGKLKSLDDLDSLKFWDVNTVDLIRPFVTVKSQSANSKFNFKEAFKKGKFDSFFRYQRVPEHKAGYDNVPLEEKALSNKYYYGNPDKYYTRLRYTYKNQLSFGVTMDKDPGEQFFKGAQKYGFDFYSFHAYYGGGKYLRRLVLGDYQIQIGQGLNLWVGYAFRKTADITNIKRSANSIKPYTSSDEARFLRGVATEIGYKNWSMVMFGSYKRVDGRALSDTLSEDDLNLITSIDLTGLHRTNSEIAKKNSFGEIIFGANPKYEKRNFNAGIAAVFQGYDHQYNNDIQPYNQYDFRGKSHVNLSADYNYVWRNINIFGEAAMAGYGGQYALIQGALLSLSSKFTLSSFYRNYSRGYSAFYNNGMGEWSNTQNEEGIYLGANFRPVKAWTVNTYFDLFNRKWLSYSANGPTAGNDFLFQTTYSPTTKLQVYGRFRQRLKQQNASIAEDGSIRMLEDQNQKNYRINFTYQVTNSIKIKSRVEVVTFKTGQGTDKGLLLQQDIVFRPRRFPLDISVRYALFNTDSYNSRLYSIEDNALYAYAIPTYYNEGSRAYILLHYSFLKHFDVWFKYGQLFYSNVKSIGTGPEMINGNIKSDITVQLRMRF